MKNKEAIHSVDSNKLKQLIPESIYLQPDKQDEGVIWISFQEGSEEALIYIYRKYAGILYNYGCQFTRDHEYVWDCIQDLFCELIKNRKRLGKVASVKGYLFKATKRKLFKGLKKSRRTVLVDANDQLFELSVPSGVTPISQSQVQEQNKLIEGYINELPSHQREVLLLYFYEGLSYQEIADIFEVKVKSIRTMTYRALETLSKVLKEKKDGILVIGLGIILEILQ